MKQEENKKEAATEAKKKAPAKKSVKDRFEEKRNSVRTQVVEPIFCNPPNDKRKIVMLNAMTGCL